MKIFINILFYLFLVNSVCYCDQIKDINTIIEAKMVVSTMLDHDISLQFDEDYTKVYGNVVTLKFTIKNDNDIENTFILNVIIFETQGEDIGS